jgi:two-component system sporulation sensor kinase A
MKRSRVEEMNNTATLTKKRLMLENYLLNGTNSYQSLFVYNNDAFFAIDLSGYYIFLNPACEGIFGYSNEEILTKKFIEVTAFEDVTKVSAFFYKAIEGGIQNYDCKINHRNGQIVELNITNLPIVVDDEIIGVYGVAKNITDIKQRRQKLKDSEELYRILTENSMDLITKTDLNGIYLYVSPVCEQILGYKPEELVGRSSYHLVHKEDLEKYTINHLHLTDIQTKALNTFRMRKKNGDYIFLESLSNAFIKSNNDVEIISVSRDITERIMAEEDRKKTQELLLNSEKLSVAGQLAAGIAHEVRNPLTAIKGFLQLMKIEDEQKAYMEIIQSEISRIEMILTELLIIAKPQVMKFKKTAIQDLLKSVKTLLDTQAILNNIEIELDTPEVISEIMCDENQLKQVFINFIKNSIEAMPTGGEIKIQVTEAIDHVLLRFSDTGSGIPKENLKRIGEPFFTTKERGTGLGLLVSKQIIENHNGHILIDSDGNGTSIEVTLPFD